MNPGALNDGIKIFRGVQKQLEELPKADYTAAKAKIDALANNPRPFGFEKLKDRPCYRVRQGNFLIIYEIYDKALIVEVIRIGDRKDVYR